MRRAGGLAGLQEAFVAAVRGEAASAALLGQIRADGLDPDRRLDVYRNNARASARGVLAATYPVIERLVGAEFFDGLAARHLAAHPSRSGDVTRIGRGLPDQLAGEFGPDSRWPWLADVARLEWALAEAYVAADAPVLGLADLAALGEGATPDLALALHPAVRLVASRWPVLAVWRAHQGAEPDGAAIDFSQGECVRVRRTPAGTLLEALPRGAFALMSGCAAGSTLEAALAAAAAADPGFDAPDALLEAVRAGVFVKPPGP